MKKICLTVSFAWCVFVYISPAGVIAGPLDNWHRRSITGYFFQVAFGNDTFVAVTDAGEIVRSDDGRYWALAATPTTNILRCVTYGAGRWIVVGVNGAILSSADGIAWTTVASGTTQRLLAVSYQSPRFITTGDAGLIGTSTDGQAWQFASLGVTNNLYGVTGGGNRLMAVGSAGIAFTSTNAADWLPLPPVTDASLLEVTYAVGQFVAVGDGETIVTSTDAKTWSVRHFGGANSLVGVTYGLGQFVATGERGTILTSADGIVWNRRVADTGNALDSVALGNGRFVIVGAGGAIVTSTNATDWVNESIPFSQIGKSITFAAGRFIAIANRLLYESPDGVRWSGHQTPIPNFNQGHAVAYGNGVFVGVGVSGTIASSTNLVDWRVDDVNSDSDFHAVAYAAGHFVAVGSSATIAESTDGYAWNIRNTRASFNLTDVAYGNGRFVAVGGGNSFKSILLTSGDGQNWNISLPGPTSFSGIAFGNDLFVALGLYPISTPDGMALNPVSGISANLGRAAFGEGRFLVAIGSDLLTSLDTLNWSQLTINGSPPQVATDAASGLSTFIVVERGSLWQSDPLPPLAPTVIATPDSRVVRENAVVVLNGAATASDPRGYQWFKDAQPIPGATNSWLEIAQAHASDSGSYSFVVSNAIGQAASGHTSLTVATTNAPLTFWRLRNSSVAGKPLTKLAIGLNLYAALDNAGAIRISTNGIVWTTVDASTANRLTMIRFINGRFIAVGESSAVVFSSDGFTWNNSVLPASVTLSDIAFGNGMFVVVGADGSILASPDLVRWGEFDAGVTANLHAVVYGQGLFVTVGDSGVILTSFDGQKWEAPVWQFNEIPTLNNLYAVATGNTGFLAGGEAETLVISVDGVEWRNLDVPISSGMRRDFTYAFDLGQRMVAGGPGLIATVQFTANSGSGGGRAASEYLANAVNDNGAIIGVGQGGALLTDSGPFLQLDALHLNGIAASLDLAVAVGRFGSILISSNALDWAQINSGVADDLNSAAYANGVFVVVGNASAILSSTNGFDWRAQQIHPIGNLSQVTFGGGWFVASAGNNPVAISADGSDWTVIPVTTWNSISDVSYGNGLFIGGGSSPVVISADPHTWTRSIPGVLNGPFQTVGFGNGMFVLFSGSYESPTVALTTTDGTTWTKINALYDPMMLHRLRYGAGHFVAVGDDGRIASSSNGTNFVSDISGTTWNLRDVTFFKNTFLTVGDYGTILQSDPLSSTLPPEPAKLTATLTANGQVRLSLAGTPGATYLIEYTDVLETTPNWSILASFTATTNSSPVPVNAQLAQSQARFFRARLQD